MTLQQILSNAYPILSLDSEGNYNVNSKSITNLGEPKTGSSAATKSYVDNAINIDYSKVITPLLFNMMSSVIYEQFVSDHCSTLYKIDRASSTQVAYNTIGAFKYISTLFDQTRHEINASSVTNLRPILEDKDTSIDDMYAVKFNNNRRLTCNINMNTPIVNIFVVFEIDAYTKSIAKYGHNAVFGNDDGRNNGKFITFNTRKQLIVSGVTGHNIVTSYPSNANAGELYNYKVLSVHWNLPTDINKSYIYCNGKKLLNFTSNSSTGTTTTTIGDLSNSISAPLNGKIAFFSFYKKKLTEQIIKLHHKVLCERYKITPDPI